MEGFDTNTPFVRLEAPFQIAPQWELAFRVEGYRQNASARLMRALSSSVTG
jgi:hypothetical protein